MPAESPKQGSEPDPVDRLAPAGDAPLLLVGHQQGLARAVERLGRPALVLLARGRRRPAHPGIVGVREVDLQRDLASVERAARELLDGRRPAAVVATAERTVVVAAHLREAFGAPGNSRRTALACADKVVMKRAMQEHDVPVATWREVTARTTAKELVDALGLPLMLKPRRDSGGRKQRRVTTVEGAERALAEIAALESGGYGWLAEGWVEGVEMSVESFVHGGNAIFFNPTEYFVPRHANILPAVLRPESAREIRAFAERAVEAAGVERGITHVELFRTRRGLVLGELASRPPGGRLMKLLARAWGFDPWEALLRIELGECPTLPTEPRRTSGVWIVHPGAGRLRAIHGVDTARAVPGVRRVALKAEPGDLVAPREGSGQDLGAIFADGADRDAVAASLTAAHRALRFELE
ncbi:argininosuccinate lyase [Planctomycetes bacterium Pla163]|uniref:Argininosuccinate lyase n=1 Tax=Rohdeia mirabilis TaxID=2528008 RepID=A0A518CZK7_9BACT|nr:argininosuccinate lyase [Planctomycetes bacterium Pla163]